MTSARSTFTIERELAECARRLGINVSAAAREGVEAAVRAATARADREAYRRRPERPDPFWSDVEAWTEERPGARSGSRRSATSDGPSPC